VLAKMNDFAKRKGGLRNVGQLVKGKTCRPVHLFSTFAIDGLSSRGLVPVRLVLRTALDRRSNSKRHHRGRIGRHNGDQSTSSPDVSIFLAISPPFSRGLARSPWQTPADLFRSILNEPIWI
jgi:hypothetical protein